MSLCFSFDPLFMAALWNRTCHYIFILWFLSFYLLSSFFPRLISAAAYWMSTILRHMVWPYCEFRMQVWNVLRAACWKCRTQKIAKNWPFWHHRTTLSGYIFATIRHVSTIEKKIVKQQCVLHMFPQYGELKPTSGWDRSGSSGHPGLQISMGFASWQRYCTAL